MNELLNILIENSTRLIINCDIEYERYFVSKLNFTQKLLGLIGARGAGN